MTDIELICEALSATQLCDLNKQLDECNSDKNNSKQILLQQVGSFRV